MKKIVKNYFIPNDENENSPHSLREKSIKFFLVIVLISEIGFLTFNFAPFASTFRDNLAAILPGVLIASTNDERSERNIATLKINSLLTEAAQLKANDMANREFFSHVNPDGEQPWYYIEQVGYEYEAAGENLAVNFIDSKDVHKAWMKSPTHKANIVQSKFTEIGIATARGRYKNQDVVFVAQFFATPKAVSATELAFVEPTFNAVGQEIQENREIIKEDLPEVLGVEVNNSENNQEKIIEEPIILNNDEIINKLASSPRSIITLIVSFILIFVLISLLLKIFIKIKIQKKQLILYGILLMIVIASILVFNEQITNYFGEIK